LSTLTIAWQIDVCLEPGPCRCYIPTTNHEVAVKLCALLAAALLSSSTVPAQAPSDVWPNGSTLRADGMEISLVAENPFSALYRVQLSRTSDDGSVETMSADTNVARDSDGRVYRERHRLAAAGTDEPSSPTSIFILDPVAHTATTCEVAARRCRVSGYHGPQLLRPPPDGSLDPGVHFVSSQNLGDDIIEGLRVTGARETVTSRGGWPGCQQEVSMRESWYSPDLGVNLSVTGKGPTEVMEVIRVVDLSRTDPDPALFQMPANFTVEDRRIRSGGLPQSPTNH
jgi:hypothetical protein